MPQAGIDPMRQSHSTYEASTLPPSHHGWMYMHFIYLSQQLRYNRNLETGLEAVFAGEVKKMQAEKKILKLVLT